MRYRVVHMLKLLHRYILKEALLYLAICLFAFTTLLLVIRMLKFTDLIVNKGVEFKQVALIFLSIIPTFLEFAIPMATLLAVMLSFARMSGDSEIVVMRASGISLKQLIKPVFILGTLILLISSFISLKLRPWGNHTLSTTLYEIARTKTIAGLEEGIFNKLGEITLYAEIIDHKSGMMKKILIEDRRNGLRKIILSKTGQLYSGENSVNGITFLLNEGSIHEIKDSNYSLTNFNTNSFTIPPDEFYGQKSEQKRADDTELNWNELDQRQLEVEDKLNHLENETDPLVARKEYKRQLANLRIEFGRRFTMPFAGLLFALLGMPFGIQAPRAQKTWGTSLSVGLSMIIFVIYYAVLSISITLAQSNTFSPYLAVCLPNIVVGSITFYGLREMSKERWQSITDPFDALIKVLGRKQEVA